ncbi:MAG: translocation/assembly module TamB domain-containing protein [Capsulimonas sp.]|uniref:translocation/assembly module TamB domain-containing protein n=1 Tax=Capsulimonas sp. TaxID=2494211 RepID=UPI003267F53C
MRLRKPPSPARLPRGPILPRPIRWANRLLLIGPVTAVAVAAAVSLHGVWLLLSADLPPILAAEISRQIKHEVRIGRVAYSTPGVLTVENVSVSTGATFAERNGEAALIAPRLTVYYDWRALVFDSGNAAHAVGDVILERPRLLVEQFPNKRFNFSDILETKTKKTGKPFAGRVIIHGGALSFRDYSAPKMGRQTMALTNLLGVEAVVDLRSEQTAYFNVAGQGNQNLFNSLVLHGAASRKTAHNFRLVLDGQNFDAAYWAAYARALPQAHIAAGRADAHLLLFSPSKTAPLDIAGNVSVRGGVVYQKDARVLHGPVRDITGQASFTQSGLSLNGVASVAGQPFYGQGVILDFKHPQVTLTVGSRGLSVAALSSVIPQLRMPKGVSASPVSVVARITGPIMAPAIVGDIVVPSMAIQGNILRDVRAHGVYANKIVSVPLLTGRVGQGTVSLRGSADLTNKKPLMSFAGRGQGLDLSQLRTGQPTKTSIGGFADIAFVGGNAGRPLTIVSNVTVAHARLQQTLLQSFKGRLTYVDGQGLTLNRVLIADAHGAGTASGKILLTGKDPVLDLSINAASLQLGPLLKPYTKQDIDGLAFFQGRLTGTVSAPRAEGDLHLFHAHIDNINLDAVTGRIAASPNGMRLQDIYVRRYPARAYIDGTITKIASGNPVLDLRASLAEGNIPDFMALVDPKAQQKADKLLRKSKAATVVANALPTVTGVASGKFQISGRLKTPQVTGSVAIDHGSVNAYRIDHAQANIAYANKTIHLDKAVVRSGSATVTGDAQYNSATGKVNGIFAGTNVSLSRFHRYTNPIANVLGDIDFSGSVGGTVKSPAVTFGLVGRDLSVDGQKLALFTGFGSYQNGLVKSTGDPWEFDFQTVRPDGATDHIRYIVDAFRVMLPTAQAPKRRPSLALTAHIPADSPETVAHLVETVRNSKYGDTPGGQSLLAKIDALPRPLAARLSLPSFSLNGPLNALAAHGELQLDSAQLGTNSVNSLNAKFGYEPGEKGRSHLDLIGKEISVAGVALSDLTASAEYANRVVTLDSLRISNEKSLLTASGTADLDGAIDATLEASYVPLSIFNTFLPKTRSLGGEVSSLYVSASGQTKSPDLTASISLTNPGLQARVKPAVVSGTESADQSVYTLDSIRSSTITVASAQPGGAKVLTIGDLTAYKDGKPLVTLSGSVPFRWDRLDPAIASLPTTEPLHAELKLMDLSALAAASPSIDPARTSGAVTATVDIAPGASDRAIQGKVTIAKASLGVSGADTSLTDLNGVIGFNDKSASIYSMSGKSSKGGGFQISGGATYGAETVLDLLLHLDGLQIDESSRKTYLVKNYNGAAQGKLTGELSITGPLKSPLLATPAGAPMLVSSATIGIPSTAPPAGPGSGAPAFDPRFDIHVQLEKPGKTFSARTGLLRADSNGDLSLAGSLAAPKLAAHLNVYKGQFILPPSTRLKFIKPVGIVDLRYPATDATGSGEKVLEKRVDLYAQAAVSISPSMLAANQSYATGGFSGAVNSNNQSNNANYDRPQRYTITAHIYGLLDDPDHLTIELDSKPGGLSRSQMLAALGSQGAFMGLMAGSNSAETAIKQQVGQALASIGVPMLLEPLEDQLATAFGLSSVVVDYSPDTQSFVTLTKDLGHRLELTYSHSFGSRETSSVNSLIAAPQYTLKLGYSLTNRLQLSVSTDDQKNNTLALEGVFGF